MLTTYLYCEKQDVTIWLKGIFFLWCTYTLLYIVRMLIVPNIITGGRNDIFCQKKHQDFNI